MILLAILLLCVAYVLYEIIQPVNTDLEKGDWNILICYLNCISSVRPTNQTILIIREIINLEKATLFECLKAMENYKEDQVNFPMILETSDFLWFEVPSVKKSCSLYEPT